MGSLSIGHWTVVLAVVVLMFGAGKIPVAMDDIARSAAQPQEDAR